MKEGELWTVWRKSISFVMNGTGGNFHNEKDLALSICLEAAELLELFQWKDSAEARTQTERLKEELADVLIYSYMMADNLDFDIDEIISEKLKKNAIKYPVEK